MTLNAENPAWQAAETAECTGVRVPGTFQGNDFILTENRSDGKLIIIWHFHCPLDSREEWDCRKFSIEKSKELATESNLADALSWLTQIPTEGRKNGIDVQP